MDGRAEQRDVAIYESCMDVGAEVSDVATWESCIDVGAMGMGCTSM